jgi:hypothetical protein
VYLRFVCAWKKHISIPQVVRLQYAEAYGVGVCEPVLTTHSPSSLTRTHWLASSNSKSCSNSTRFAYSLSFFKLLFRLRASHSGSCRDVPSPAMVYTGTEESVVNFMLKVSREGRQRRSISRTFLEMHSASRQFGLGNGPLNLLPIRQDPRLHSRSILQATPITLPVETKTIDWPSPRRQASHHSGLVSVM